MVSTIFNSTRSLRYCTVCLTAMVLLSACSVNQVVVEGSFPPPLMNTVPMTLGVFYEDEFANHEFYEETKSKQQSDWIVKTGQAQVQMWDVLLGGMFENLVHLPSRPTPENKNPLVDAVLIPHIEELQYALPAQTNVKVYEIWMRYRFEMVTPDGDAIAEWTMTAYGKTPTAFLQSSVKAVNLAAVMALRDAGAHFVIIFFREPAVQEWINQTAGVDHE